MPRMTEQQLRDYEAKRNRDDCELRPLANHLSGAAEEIRNECDLHNSIIDYCRERGWQYLHGSMAHKTRRVCGEPDFIILAHGAQKVLVECKSKNGKLSTDQQAFMAHARKNGHVVHVVRTMEEFTKLFV